MSKPARPASRRRGSSARRSSERPARRPSERPARHPSKRPARRRRERSFLDMLIISALIVIAAFIAVVLWIVLRGLF